MVIVKRALVSCHNKTGLDAFARGLAALGVELVASKGTAAFLHQHGLSVRPVEKFAGIEEQLDGRVKTLHPKIHAGILANRQDPAHLKAVGADGLIDLVVVNLYPFHEVSQRPGVSLQDVLEQIDIGGVALLRAAAKNFAHVAAVSNPQQYPTILSTLQQGQGTLPEEVSRELAGEAFQITSQYDQWIASFLASHDQTTLPESVSIQAITHQALRYGENPHQHAAWYVPLGEKRHGLAVVEQLQGKALSYNNLMDLDAAIRCVAEFEEPTCVIVKHASPCGVASAETIAEAYARAYAGDAESAFGGIVGINRSLDAATASQMASTFLEVIIAPSIAPEAKAVLAQKSNLRLLTCEVRSSESRAEVAKVEEWRSVLGGWLIQEQDLKSVEASTMRVVTKRRPSDAQQRDLILAWLVAKHVKSNAIVIAKDRATGGIGQGQPSRVRAVRLAIQNAGERSRGAVLASDGFFPFPDSVELAAQAGIMALIQPGGSLKDAEVIAAADEAGLAMVFTGLRHFRH